MKVGVRYLTSDSAPLGKIQLWSSLLSVPLNFNWLINIFIHLQTHFSSGENCRSSSSPRRTRTASQFSAISNSSIGSTLRLDQARSNIWCHLILGQPLGCFPVSRSYFTNLYWNILITFPSQHSWDLSIRRRNVSISRTLQISLLHTHEV